MLTGSFERGADVQAAFCFSPASAYSLAKAGLQALPLNLARELVSAGIRVNAVSPDIVHTPIYEGFMAKEDIADAMKAMSHYCPLVSFLSRVIIGPRTPSIKWYLIICEDYSVNYLHYHPNMQY